MMQKQVEYGRKGIADINTPLLYNHWYVAGLANEFTEELRERTILNRSLVFYRRSDGSPVALQNRCAHRSFPLSKSTLDEDGIRCGYHGIKYRHDGSIQDVPCQATCPATQIRSYPVKQVGPLIWIWMGKQEDANEEDIPEPPVHDGKNWTLIVGNYNYMEGSYLLMLENLCDLSHIPYLHSKTFNIPDAYVEIPIEMERNGNQVDFYRHLKSWGMIKNLFHPSVDFTDRKISHKSGARFVSPATVQGYSMITPLDEEDSQQATGHYINHYMTPETQYRCHYYWYVARNYALNDSDFDKKFGQLIQSGFDEDKFAVSQMQKVLENDQHDFREIYIAGDKPGVAMRQIVYRLAENE